MILLIILFLVAIAAFYVYRHPGFGKNPHGELLERIQSSPNYVNGAFVNKEITPMRSKDVPMMEVFKKMIRGTENGKPVEPIETVRFNKEAFMNQSSPLVFTWFGHSTVLIKTGGKTILTDPVFSSYASPIQGAGTRSFEFTNQYHTDSLPEIDYLVLSHDHYDHLDYHSIKNIKDKVGMFLVPLGVDAHLIRWGVPQEKIFTADWGDTFSDDGILQFTATPARHFSGRGLNNRNQTLWCSWVISANDINVFFGGDSGYGRHFGEIGETYGPFDLTFIECGQYNDAWPYIHAKPEETVKAHIDLKGAQLVPIHWGKFKLSTHPWEEPLERAAAAAEKSNVNLIRVRIGEILPVKNS